MKRDQKFALANSSSHGWFDVVERLKMAVLIRERTRMLDFFGMYLLLRYKVTGLLENFGERGAKIRDLQQINNFESVT